MAMVARQLWVGKAAWMRGLHQAKELRRGGALRAEKFSSRPGRLLSLSAGLLAWNLKGHVATCEAAYATPQKATRVDATVQIAKPDPARRGWMDKLAEWLHYLYRWIYLSFVYSPAIAASPLLLVGSESLHEFWWRLLTGCVKASGPCGIKFAQWLSTRPDLFPVGLCRRFQDLQSYSGRLSWKSVQGILAEAFGPDWTREFTIDLDAAGEPIVLGEGCVAQVLRGRTTSGQRGVHPVAVKVVRPEARSSIQTDAQLMWLGAKMLELVSPWVRCLSLADSVDEFRLAMLTSCDMQAEAQNLRTFRQNFLNRNKFLDNTTLGGSTKHAEVTFPEPVPGLVSENVLVETLETGTLLRECLSECSLTEKQALGKLLLDVVFQMAFMDNFVHTDLHPGNILCQGLRRGVDLSLLDGAVEIESTAKKHSVLDSLRDMGKKGKKTATTQASLASAEPSLRLCILDAGMTTKVLEEDVRQAVQLFKAVALNDGALVARLLTAQREGEVAGEDFQAAVTKLLDSMHLAGLRLHQIPLTTFSRELTDLCRTFQLQLPGRKMRLVAALGVAEGVLRELDPHAIDMETVIEYIDLL